MDLEQLRGTVLGFAVGDALGVPVEFMTRSKLVNNPVTGMRGFGSHHQPPGTWSDDTSLTLALLDSLSVGLDYYDQGKKFSRWLFDRDYTPGGVVFDVGNTTRIGINNFKKGHDPIVCGEIDEASNGNGSLMRISPLSFFLYKKSVDQRRTICFQVSSLTHGHSRSKIACWLYTEMLIGLITGLVPEKAVDLGWLTVDQWVKENGHTAEWSFFNRCHSGIKTVSEENIKSTGYVIHTLEAALWAFLTSDSYPKAVLKAVNLGNDTDTVGAVTGSFAGLYWGVGGIPKKWIEALRNRSLIEGLCLRFAQSESIPH